MRNYSQIQSRPTPQFYELRGWKIRTWNNNVVQAALLTASVYFLAVVQGAAALIGTGVQSAALTASSYLLVIFQGQAAQVGTGTQSAALTASVYA